MEPESSLPYSQASAVLLLLLLLATSFNENICHLPCSQQKVRKFLKTFGSDHIKVEDQGGVNENNLAIGSVLTLLE